MARRFFVDEIVSNSASCRTASVKPRADIRKIMLDRGFEPIGLIVPEGNGEDKTVVAKVVRHLAAYRKWTRIARSIPSGGMLVIQYPPFNNSYLLYKVIDRLASRDVEVVLLVHDIELLRVQRFDSSMSVKKAGLMKNDVLVLRSASRVIAHNSSMKAVLVDEFDVDPDRVISLDLFDYLFEGGATGSRRFAKGLPVVIAGSFSRHKAGYVYDLPRNQAFRLYGVGLDEKVAPENAEYCGSFPPDELPGVLSGSFGLVWDGGSTRSCTGAFGEYLKINNPHKASLYIAAGMPVIIWDQAALASFVVENGLGLAIASLDEIDQVIESVSDAEYEEMLQNVAKCSERVRTGCFLSRVLDLLAETNGISTVR